MPHSINSAGRLDRLPIARFHRKILLLISAGAFLDAFDLYLANDSLAAMVKDGFADMHSGAMFISATFVGMVLGAALSGHVGDRYGRRVAYQINLAIFGLASLAACFAPDMRWLIGLRFIMGLGLGAELVVAAGTLTEFIPPTHRGKWISLVGLVINSALPVVSLLGYGLIPHLGWRYMFAIVGGGALCVWYLRHGMPESPRWLESVGRCVEAEATLRAIESSVEAERGPLPPVTRPVAQHAGWVPFRALFAKGMLGRTLTAAMTGVAINVGLYGFIAWLPTIFVKQGFSMVQSFGFVLLMSFGAPLGGLLSYVVADRVGRARSIIYAALLSIVLGCVYVSLHGSAAIVIAGFGLISTLYAITTLGLLGYIPELFPTEMRLRGTGLAATVGRSASVAMPYITLKLYGLYGVTGVLAFVSATLLVLCLAIISLRIETSGQSLEDIAPRVSAGVADEVMS